MKKKGFDHRKYWKMFGIKFSYRVMELMILGVVGYGLGLRLVRY